MPPKRRHSVNPRPTPSCFSGSFQAAFPEAAFRRLGSTWSAKINLVLFNRRVAQSYLSLRNSASNFAQLCG